MSCVQVSFHPSLSSTALHFIHRPPAPSTALLRPDDVTGQEGRRLTRRCYKCAPELPAGVGGAAQLAGRRRRQNVGSGGTVDKKWYCGQFRNAEVFQGLGRWHLERDLEEPARLRGQPEKVKFSVGWIGISGGAFKNRITRGSDH